MKMTHKRPATLLSAIPSDPETVLPRVASPDKRTSRHCHMPWKEGKENGRNQLFGALVLVICLWPISASAEHEHVGEPAVTVQETVGEPSEQPVPSTLTLPVGTLITVRTTQWVSSDRNRPGDAFTTVLEQPVVARGWVLARRGQVVVGRVVVAQEAGRVQGVSELAVELTELVLVDGQQVPVRTHLMTGSGDTSLGRDAEIIGTTTGVGVLVGAAAGGGRGAAIGAAVGAAAGLAGILTTRGQPTEIHAETVLTFRLEAPLAIFTQQSQHAFQPVTPEDYEDRGTFRVPQSHPADRGERRGRIGIEGRFEYPPYHHGRRYLQIGYRGYYDYWYTRYYDYGFRSSIYVVPRTRGYTRRSFHRTRRH